MNKTPMDWDITTSADPQQVKRLFRHTYDTGIAHGTVTVVIGSKHYEVTTFRVDGEYLDGRHPSHVAFTRSLYEDLKRRDFTMNAIAWHHERGYIDPFGGIADIEAKLIRGVGDAGQRFREDGLRMLRAVRFAAQLDFTIELRTWQALLENAPLIKKISMERVRDELLKLLISNTPEKITLLSVSGLTEYLSPLLAEHLRTFEAHRLAAIEPDATLRLAILLRGLEGTKGILRHFKIDNKSIKLLSALLCEIETPIMNDCTHIRKRLANISPEVFRLLTRLFEAYGEDMSQVRAKLDAILAKGHCIDLRTLAISGDDLKKLGITDGRTIGRALDALFAHVLETPEDNAPQTLARLAGQYVMMK